MVRWLDDLFLSVFLFVSSCSPLWFLYPFFPLLFFLCSFQSAYSLFFFWVYAFVRFSSSSVRSVFCSFSFTCFFFVPLVIPFLPCVFLSAFARLLPSGFPVCVLCFFFSPSRPRVFSSFGFLCFFRPVLDCEGKLGFCYRSSGKKLKSPSGFFGLFPSLCFHPSSVAFLWECHAVTQTKKRTCRTITVVTEMHRGRGAAGRDTVHE